MEGYIGRVVKYVSGKEIKNPFIKQLYFSAGRQLINFYEEIDRNKSELSSLEKDPDSFSIEETNRILENKGNIKRTKELLKEYREVLEENGGKDNEETFNLKTLILDEIDTLR